jgi:hypothetical protein
MQSKNADSYNAMFNSGDPEDGDHTFLRNVGNRKQEQEAPQIGRRQPTHTHLYPFSKNTKYNRMVSSSLEFKLNTQAYGGVHVQLHTFLTSTLDGVSD